MCGSPQREIGNTIYKTNNQTKNSSFPFLSLFQWIRLKNYPQQPRSLFFHIALWSLLPRTKDKSTSSNVRREGWWITNPTVTDPSAPCCFFCVCGKGTKQGEKKLLTKCQWVYRSWPHEYWAIGNRWPHGEDIQDWTIGDPKALRARELTLPSPNENVPGSYHVMNDIYLLFQTHVVLWVAERVLLSSINIFCQYYKCKWEKK